jgi:hypothetical protein
MEGSGMSAIGKLDEALAQQASEEAATFGAQRQVAVEPSAKAWEAGYKRYRYAQDEGHDIDWRIVQECVRCVIAACPSPDATALIAERDVAKAGLVTAGRLIEQHILALRQLLGIWDHIKAGVGEFRGEMLAMDEAMDAVRVALQIPR